MNGETKTGPETGVELNTVTANNVHVIRLSGKADIAANAGHESGVDNGCDNSNGHFKTSVNVITENGGSGYVTIFPRKNKHSYSLNESPTNKKKRIGWATKVCIFFTGFIIGLLLSLLILSALQISEIPSKLSSSSAMPSITTLIIADLSVNNNTSNEEANTSLPTSELLITANQIQSNRNKKQFNNNDSQLSATVSTLSTQTTPTFNMTTASTITRSTSTTTTTTNTRITTTSQMPDTIASVINESSLGDHLITTTATSAATASPPEAIINNSPLVETDDVIGTTSLMISNATSTIDTHIYRLDSITTSTETSPLESMTPFEANETDVLKASQLNRTDKALDLGEDGTTEAIEINETTASIQAINSGDEDRDANESKHLVTERPNDPLIGSNIELNVDFDFNNISNDTSDHSVVQTKHTTTTEPFLVSKALTSPSFATFSTPTPTTITIALTQLLYNDSIHLPTENSIINSETEIDLDSNDTPAKANRSEHALNNATVGDNDVDLNGNNSDIYNNSITIGNNENISDSTNIDSIDSHIDSNGSLLHETGDYSNESLTSLLLLNQSVANASDLRRDSRDSGHNSTESSVNASSSLSPELYCLSTQFSCPNETNRCLDKHLICDGLVDCPLDGFDELDCNASDCSPNFMCNRSLDSNSSAVQCVSRQAYCDGIRDCEDGSDEFDCHLQLCQKGEFRCRDGSACIKGRQACDGNYNCFDHSDEIGCVSRTGCQSMGRFYCDDGLCIERSLRCDGIADCSNGTDEHNCTCHINEFRCATFECVNSTLMCNGVRDCADGSDEYECVRSDESGVVQVYDPDAQNWSLLCAKASFDTIDADRVCHHFGFWRSANYSLLAVTPLNSSWANGLPGLAEQTGDDVPLPAIHSPVCDTNLTVSVFCEQIECGQNQRGLDISDNSTDLKQSSEDVPSGVTIVADGDDSGRGRRECAAQIISTKWLLASAQCVLNFTLSGSYVRLLNESEPINISRIVINPKYSKFRSLRVAHYDLALIETSRALNTSATATVCLPEHEIDAEITCFVGTRHTIGDTSGDIAYEIVEKRVCNSSQHFNGSITSSHLCANVKPSASAVRSTFGSDHNSDRNDRNKACVANGSPLICLSSASRWYVAGFSSYQHGCNASLFATHPTIFSSVYSMKPFIERVIGVNQYRVHTGGDRGYVEFSQTGEFNGITTDTTTSNFINDTQINGSVLDNNSLLNSSLTYAFNETTIWSENLNMSSIGNNNTVDNASNHQNRTIDMLPISLNKSIGFVDNSTVNQSLNESVNESVNLENETISLPNDSVLTTVVPSNEQNEDETEPPESHISEDTDDSTEPAFYTDATESDDTTEPHDNDDATESPTGSEDNEESSDTTAHGFDSESTEPPESEERSNESNDSEEAEEATTKSGESESEETEDSTETDESENNTELPNIDEPSPVNTEPSDSSHTMQTTPSSN